MAVAALVASRGVVGVEVLRDLAGRRQQAVLFLVKGFVTVGQHPVDLTRGNIHAQLAQFLVEQRLGDMIVEVLVEHVGT